MLPSLFILLCIFLINFIFLDLPVHFYSGRKAELEAWQRIRRKSTTFYLISIIRCLQHWNIISICFWKKCYKILISFLYFCNSKTSTITRNALRRINLGFSLKMKSNENLSLTYSQLNSSWYLSANYDSIFSLFLLFQLWICRESTFYIIQKRRH